MKILSIGECMAELAPTETSGGYSLGFAGDTFNTAWYLAQIDPEVQVSYLTAVGTDHLSQNMRAFIRISGIDDSYVQVLPDCTVGLYMITLDQGERSFSYWRGQSAAKGLAHDRTAMTQAINDADIVYFSGITLAILAPDCRHALLNALQTARTAGKTIVFDPNLRRKLWLDAGDMLETTMRGAASSDVVLPSFEDEADWFSDPTPQATIQRYVNAGATTVVVKNGASAVAYQSRNENGSIIVPPLAKVVDTTAAGDSFNAAILSGLANGTLLANSIPFACQLARQVVLGKGALVNLDIEATETLTA